MEFISFMDNIYQNKQQQQIVSSLIDYRFYFMNQILESKTGLFITTLDWTDRQVIRLYLISQFIFLFPFFVAEMSMIGENFSDCLLANFVCQNITKCHPKALSYFTLGQWIQVDGYFKLAFFITILLFVVLDTQVPKNLAPICGNLIRFFYLFDFGWTITGSALFWGSNKGFPEPTYTQCDAPYKGYIFFLLIFSYIIIPINLYIGSLRPNPRLREQITIASTGAGDTTRRDTELIKKQGLNE